MKYRQKLKKLIKILIVCMSVAFFSSILMSCNRNNEKTIKPPIHIEDIDWTVNEKVVHGKQEVVFSYTNNIKYIISDMEIKFTLKNGVTDKELKVFDSSKEKYHMHKEDIKKIFILGYSLQYVEPQKTADFSPCKINGYIPVESIAQYEILQPDIAIIEYIDNGKIYSNIKTILINNTTCTFNIFIKQFF